MTSQFDAQQKSIGDILSQKATRLKVPIYQRDYSWTDSEIEQFWDDVKALLDGIREEHFFGAITFKKESSGFEVIDGQQRLATFCILIAATRDIAAKAGDQTRSTMLGGYLADIDPDTLQAVPRLSLNQVNNPVFQEVVDAKVASLEQRKADKTLKETNRLLVAAYFKLHSLVSKEVSLEGAKFWVKLLQALPKSFQAIVINVSETANAFLIFETLNDRGLELSTADLLKNFFLMSLGGQKVDATKVLWDETISQLNSAAATAYVRHYYLSNFGVVREKELFRTIVKKFQKAGQISELLKGLNKSSKIYGAFQSPNDPQWILGNLKLAQVVQASLDAMKEYRTFQCFPLLLAAREILPDSGFAKICNFLSIFSFRYSVVCQRGTGNLERVFSECATQLRSDGKKAKLNQALGPLVSLNPTDTEFQGDFQRKSFKSDRLSRYILCKINDYLEGDGGLQTSTSPAKLNLEHIVPKSGGADWVDVFSSEAEREALVDRLGNMTLLPPSKNAKIGNASFNDKVKVLIQSNLQINKKISEFSSWDMDAIEDYQAWLSDQAMVIWKLPAI